MKFKLNTNGVGLTAFRIQISGPLTITVTLATKPPQTRTLHLTLDASSVIQQGGCMPT